MEAVRQQLIERLEEAYRFIHDRVQEAAYSVIGVQSRAKPIYNLGAFSSRSRHRISVRNCSPDRQSAQPRGRLDYLKERGVEHLAELNLIAGETRQDFCGLCLGVQISHCGCDVIGRRSLGAPTSWPSSWS